MDKIKGIGFDMDHTLAGKGSPVKLAPLHSELAPDLRGVGT